MGLFFCLPRKSEVLELNKYIFLLNDVTSIVGTCLDLIHIDNFNQKDKSNELIDALGVFLNGLYSYLLKTQSVLSEKESNEAFQDDYLFILKISIQNLEENLKNPNLLFEKKQP